MQSPPPTEVSLTSPHRLGKCSALQTCSTATTAECRAWLLHWCLWILWHVDLNWSNDSLQLQWRRAVKPMKMIEPWIEKKHSANLSWNLLYRNAKVNCTFRHVLHSLISATIALLPWIQRLLQCAASNIKNPFPDSPVLQRMFVKF